MEFITRGLLYFRCVYVLWMLYWCWLLRTLNILSFIVYLYTLALVCHQYNWFCIFHLKCTFIFWRFHLCTFFCMKCCMYHHGVLCIDDFICFVRNDEIKMCNQSIIVSLLYIILYAFVANNISHASMYHKPYLSGTILYVLKPPASRLFAQLFVQAKIKENFKGPLHYSLCERNPPVMGGFPSQRVSNVEIVSIWWRHHETIICLWSYSTACKYSKPYLRTLGRGPRDTLPYVQISFDWAL